MSDASTFIGGSAPKVWVSGTTYAAGKVVWSPTDYQYYMNKSTGVRATDPASDPTNWQPTGERAIKSIQRGVASASPITISAVVMAKTELRWLGGVTQTTGVIDGVPTIQLTSTTQISANFAGTYRTVGWELTERY